MNDDKGLRKYDWRTVEHPPKFLELPIQTTHPPTIQAGLPSRLEQIASDRHSAKSIADLLNNPPQLSLTFRPRQIPEGIYAIEVGGEEAKLYRVTPHADGGLTIAPITDEDRQALEHNGESL